MSIKKRKTTTVAAPVTTEQMITSVTKRFEDDIKELDTKRVVALNVFRNTATSLASINESLTKTVDNYNNLLTTIISKKEEAQKAIVDNKAVYDKIISIIGE